MNESAKVPLMHGRIGGAVLLAMAAVVAKLAIFDVLRATHEEEGSVRIWRTALAIIPLLAAFGLAQLLGGQPFRQWANRHGLTDPKVKKGPVFFAVVGACLAAGLGLNLWMYLHLEALGFSF
jgi:hypothetical protein